MNEAQFNIYEAGTHPLSKNMQTGQLENENLSLKEIAAGYGGGEWEKRKDLLISLEVGGSFICDEIGYKFRRIA